MPSKTSGVSGVVEYDLDISCFADEHDEPQQMFETEETSNKGNALVECPECGRVRAVDVHVVKVR